MKFEIFKGKEDGQFYFKGKRNNGITFMKAKK